MKSSIAALIMLSVGTSGVAPILMLSEPATASIVAQRLDRVVPAGTSLPLRQPDGKRIIVTPEETVRVTLVTTEDVRSRRDNTIIPAGTRIRASSVRPMVGLPFMPSALTYRVAIATFMDAPMSLTIVEPSRKESIQIEFGKVLWWVEVPLPSFLHW
ncbi:MAG: hypothetical protein HC852_13765 [Acaryochloridaceae cyanobacterium RU_4_10]|nr:hypothetical protein [Acaryochloridaceae cyanobacterium RU_4_10]